MNNGLAAPKGTYTIVDEPGGAHKPPERWYGLFKNDIILDDKTGFFPPRDGFRFHYGQFSNGCVTVSRWQPDAAKKWNDIDSMMQGTSKGTPVPFKGKSLTNYGTVTIK
jgi:hypothetical protein